MRRLRRELFLLAPLAWALSACDDRATANGSMPTRTPDVGVVTIEPQRAVLTAELPGRTFPYAVSDVRPQVTGILKERLFVEGSRVEAGQPLYQIDDTLYQAAYDSARARLAGARAALATAELRSERFTSLREQKSISQQDFDDAQAALQQAEAEVAQQQAEVATARINLGYTRITAPIDGKIGRSYLTRGALVTADQDQALATIQTLDPIYVDMNQSSSELLALRQSISAGRRAEQDSARVSLTLDDGTAYPTEGKLQFSEVVVDPTTGSVTLRAEFPNPDGILLPGMFVRATIIEAVEEDALLVPQRGVGRDERGAPTALVLEADGLVHSRELTVGQTVGSNWLVTGGIAPGDRVIVEGLQNVRPGQAANAVPFQDDPAPDPASTAVPD